MASQANPLSSQTLTISDGIIISISETLPAAEIDLDLSDYTCLPGLINTHVHFDANPEDAADYGIYAHRTYADSRRYLEMLKPRCALALLQFDMQGLGFDALASAKAKVMLAMRSAQRFNLQGLISP